MFFMDINERIERILSNMEILKDFRTAMDSIDEYEVPYTEDDKKALEIEGSGINKLIIKYLKENGKDYKEDHDYLKECNDLIYFITNYQKDVFKKLEEQIKDKEDIGILECLDSIDVDICTKNAMHELWSDILMLFSYAQLFNKGKQDE